MPFISTPTMQQFAEVCFNAKVQRPGTCNAAETLLVHREIAPVALPAIASALRAAGVELRISPEAREVLGAESQSDATASDEDYATEFLGPIISARV